MQLGSEPWILDEQILEICHWRSETILLTPNSSCEACSAFTRVAACTLARSPYFVTRYPKSFRHFVTSMPAPVASGWSGRRVGLAPPGKRRLFTAHTQSRSQIYGRCAPIPEFKAAPNPGLFCDPSDEDCAFVP